MPLHLKADSETQLVTILANLNANASEKQNVIIESAGDPSSLQVGVKGCGGSVNNVIIESAGDPSTPAACRQVLRGGSVNNVTNHLNLAPQDSAAGALLTDLMAQVRW